MLNSLNIMYNDALGDYKIIKDVSDGARAKLWIEKNGIKFLYKKSKVHSSGKYTYEHYSEYITMLICNQIGISCVNIILLDNAILSQVMTNKPIKSFIELSEEFSHLFHLSNLSTYNISTLLNKSYNRYYAEVIEMLLLDALIGNSDRHPGNFMYSEDSFYPLFDNGSSLCAYVEDESIKDIMRDNNRFIAMCTTKSRPVIRDNQKLTHKELVAILRNQFPIEYNNFCNKLFKLEFSKILKELNIAYERKELLERFIDYRMNWFGV